MFYFLRLGLSILWVKPITSETKTVTHTIFIACVKAAAAVSLWKYSSSNLCHYNFLLIFRALCTQHRNIVLLQHVYLCYKAPAIQSPTRLSCRSRRHSAIICHQHIVQPQPEGSQGGWWWESSSHWVNLSDSSASGADDAVGTKQIYTRPKPSPVHQHVMWGLTLTKRQWQTGNSNGNRRCCTNRYHEYYYYYYYTPFNGLFPGQPG